MSDANAPKDEKPVLPGNHGQFGVNNATDDDHLLEDQPAPAQPAASQSGASQPGAPPLGGNGPQQTNAGERS